MDIKIRNVPKDVVLRFDRKAKMMGLSRQSYLLDLLLNYDLENRIIERERILLEVIENNTLELKKINKRIDKIK